MRKQIICMLVALTALTSCYKEEALTPTKIPGINDRFEFPQGTNAWDQTAKEIHDEFGVYLIYKNIDTMDLNRNWNTLYNYSGKDLTEEQAKFQIGFLKKHIFDYLSPKITDHAMKVFYYQVYNFYEARYPGGKDLVTNYYNGIDFWTFSIFTDTNKAEPTPDKIKEYRVRIMRGILAKAFDCGNINAPAAFFNLFDFKTEINRYTLTDVNYYKKRGFMGSLQDDAYNFSPGFYENVSYFNRRVVFNQYVFVGIRYTPEELEALYPKADYPKIHEARNMLVDHLKKTYGLDLVAIQQGPQN